MKNFVPSVLIITITGLVLLIFSCTPQSCYEDTEAFLKASFYENITGKLLAPDSLTIYGLNMENDKLYDAGQNIQPARLPLNSSSESSVFIIKINDKTDTVEFRYTSFPHLISKECGYTFYHYLDTNRIFTKHAIINIYIAKRNITTINEENIRIFY